MGVWETNISDNALLLDGALTWVPSSKKRWQHRYSFALPSIDANGGFGTHSLMVGTSHTAFEKLFQTWMTELGSHELVITSSLVRHHPPSHQNGLNQNFLLADFRFFLC
jgi:hypothetical protein